MKNFLYLFILLLAFTSCEEKIDLPLEEGPKRLVIDANINWVKGTDGKTQQIKLTETVGFYETEIPAINNASVKITDSNSNEVVFSEIDDSGVYQTTEFAPVINETYTLTIVYNDETFTATEILTSVVELSEGQQEIIKILGNEIIEVQFPYTDPEDEENYYLEESKSNLDLLFEYVSYSDEFTNGNENSADYSRDDLKAGDVVVMNFYGISKGYFNYVNLLLQQIEPGGPFATTPAALKGNCVNTTFPDIDDKKPLGYFRLSEVDQKTYTVQ